MMVSVGCELGGEELETGTDEQESRVVPKNPVVFVHGCWPGPPLGFPPFENASSLIGWGGLIQYFSANGYQESHLAQWVYSGAVCGDIWDEAADLAAYIDQVRAETGHRQVDIIAHSMGALTTRIYIKYYRGRAKVRDVAFLAGTHFGSEMAVLGDSWQQFAGGPPAYVGAQQMFPPYACHGESPDSVQFAVNGCLSEDGVEFPVDQTPQGPHVRYHNLYITNDEVNLPQHVACLNQDFIGDCSDEVNTAYSHVQPDPVSGLPAHVTMLFDPIIVSETFDRLNRSWEM